MSTKEILWGDTLPVNEHLQLAGVVSQWLEQAPETKTKTIEDLRAYPYSMYVLDDEQTIMGHAALKQLGIVSWELCSVIVKDSMRGHKIGSFLLEQITGFFTEYGEPSFQDLYVVCPQQLHRFYEDFGFHSLAYDIAREPEVEQRIGQVQSEQKIILKLSGV